MTTDLIIAGRRIRLRSEEGFNLRPDERFSAFMAEEGGEPELTVDVFPGKTEIPPDAVKVFDAPLMEETPDGLRDTGEPFWEILTHGEMTFARVYLKDPARNPVLVMPQGKMTWQIFADSFVAGQYVAVGNTESKVPADDKITGQLFTDGDTAGRSPADGRVSGQLFSDSEMTGKIPAKSEEKWQYPAESADSRVNPLPYPVDGLLLYFLSSSMGDIMIHGSGVVCGGRGWIFTGRSGSGKTTMAGIFDREGDRVIHDDRLILRKEAGAWIMHSTPVYRNDEPRSAPVDHLWAIMHGRSNVSAPVTGAEAVALVLSNCVQQNREREAATRLASAVEDLVLSVRVSRLSFLPDSRIRDYLIARESDTAVTAAGAAYAMLAEGKPVTITAGGYSMWPVIRPGDRIKLMPYNPQIPLAKGMVVALRRDGGFVVHRVTDYRRGRSINLIRTRGDASMIYDAWIPSGDVAGLVKKVTESGDSEMVSPKSMPYLLGSIAVAIIKIWNAARHRF